MSNDNYATDECIMEFKSLGKEERKLLLTALNYKLDKLKCQFCGEKLEYDKCGIMPSTDQRRKATFVCNSPLCMCEYLEITEKEPDYKKAYKILMD